MQRITRMLRVRAGAEEAAPPVVTVLRSPAAVLSLVAAARRPPRPHPYARLSASALVGSSRHAPLGSLGRLGMLPPLFTRSSRGLQRHRGLRLAGLDSGIGQVRACVRARRLGTGLGTCGAAAIALRRYTSTP
jgi:hypothetical protein